MTMSSDLGYESINQGFFIEAVKYWMRPHLQPVLPELCFEALRAGYDFVLKPSYEFGQAEKFQL